MTRLALAVALLALPFAAFALTAPAAAPARAAVVAPATPDAMVLVSDGIPRAIAPNERFATGALTATLDVRPEAPGAHVRVLVLRLRDGTGAPLTGATVGIAAQMRLMGHGDFGATALALDDGGYVASLPFTMGGEWRLSIAYSTANATGIITVDLDDLR